MQRVEGAVQPGDKEVKQELIAIFTQSGGHKEREARFIWKVQTEGP